MENDTTVVTEVNKSTSLSITLDGDTYNITIQPYKGEEFDRPVGGLVEVVSKVTYMDAPVKYGRIVLPSVLVDDVVKTMKEMAQFISMNE